MCDPLSLGALAIGAAGTAANSIGQAKAQKKQESEYNQWAQNQKQFRAQENVRQEELRGKAEVARQKGVEDISADSQVAIQQAEAARLAAEMNGQGQQPSPNPTVPASVADERLTGSEGGGEVFQTDLAKQLADAAASAKQRINAMATVNSYNRSQGGLGTVNPINQQLAGSGIDLANEMRKGSMGAYGVERNINPETFTYSNPVADTASQFLGVGMSGLGSAVAGAGGLGTIIGSAFKPKPSAHKFNYPGMF